MTDSRQYFPVLLTQAQRKAVALFLPALADRLKLEEKNQRAIPLSLAELKENANKAPVAARKSPSGVVRNSRRCLAEIATQALDRFQGIGAIPVAEHLCPTELHRPHPEHGSIRKRNAAAAQVAATQAIGRKLCAPAEDGPEHRPGREGVTPRIGTDNAEKLARFVEGRLPNGKSNRSASRSDTDDRRTRR
jgi:hypothetical protein